MSLPYPSFHLLPLQTVGEVFQKYGFPIIFFLRLSRKLTTIPAQTIPDGQKDFSWRNRYGCCWPLQACTITYLLAEPDKSRGPSLLLSFVVSTLSSTMTSSDFSISFIFDFGSHLIRTLTEFVNLWLIETSLVPTFTFSTFRSPYLRRVLRGCNPESSPLLLPSLCMISSAPSFPETGEHHDAAGFTLCYGLLIYIPFTGTYSAWAPSITRKHWKIATWLSGDYHDRTCTG